nr:hypothetical protein [Neorhizobium tomejilense]
METESTFSFAGLPHFDFDGLSDVVRDRIRIALRDDPKLAAAVTFGEGEAFVSKLSGLVAQETRRAVTCYQSELGALAERAATFTESPESAT